MASLPDYPEGYVPVDSFAALQAALNAGGNIVLTKDLTGGWPDRLQAKNDSVLDLWGHTLDRQKGSVHTDGHVIEVRSGGNLTIKDSIGTGKITGGYAKNGGGININDGGTLTLDGGTITGNKASIDGGGICVKGTFIANGGTIINNSASDTGGGIYVSTSGIIQLTNITIANNTSSNYGGGLNVHVKDNNNSWILNSYIINNKTKDVGGAIYYNESGKTFTVTRTTIAGNTAEDHGGAIYNNNGTIVLVNCNIYNNTTDGDGGAIYNNDATVTITGGTINNNYCKKSGGAIRAYDGTTNINNVTFTGNTAKESGGAIYLNNGGTVSINGCTMEGNTAGEKGGAVIVNDSSGNTFTIQGTIKIYGNKGGDGNDLYLASGKKITIIEALGEDTKIGVTLEKTTGTFTSGFGTNNPGKDPAKFFIANSGYTAYLNGSEAAIAKMSASTTYTVNVSRADGKTTSMTVRLKLLKNGLDYQTQDLTITSQSGVIQFNVDGGANVYTLTAEITDPENPVRYTCSVTEGSALFTVVCRDVVSETETAISAIGTVEYTDACKAKIDAARSAYDALTGAQKNEVTNSSSLTNAENKYVALGVDSLINAIGTVVYTDTCKAKIDKARGAYDALTADQKQQVTVYETLTAAETAYNKLKTDHAAADPVIAKINDIGPYPAEEYTNRVTAARTAYNVLNADQRALVTNYNLLVAAESNLNPPTSLPAGLVSFAGWTYGNYTQHDPTIDTSVVADPTLKGYLDGKISLVTFSYEDSSKNGVLPSNTLPAGTYKVKAIFPMDSPHPPYWAEAEFTVGKATLIAQDLTIGWAGSAEYDGSAKTVTVTAKSLSLGNGLTADVMQGTAIVDPILPGTYTVKLTITDSNYQFNIPGATGTVYSASLDIQKGSNSITSLSLDGWVYGDAPAAPSAAAEVGTPTFTYSSSLSGPYTVNVPKNAGNYYVKATVAETDLYAQTTEVLPFTISKATLSVSADSKTVKVGDPMPTFTYSVSGFIGGDTWNGCFNSNPTLTSTCTTTAQYGQYLITISNGNVSPKTPGNNYTLAFTNGVLSIQGDNVHWVSFNLNYTGYPEEDVPESIQAYKNLPYGPLPSVSKPGYELGGWYTEQSGGTLISSSTIFDGDSDQILYAHWITTVTLVFGDEEEDNGKMSLAVTYNSNIFETITSPGSGFIGYFTPTGDKLIDSNNLSKFVDTAVTGYIDSSGNWIADGPKTIYAHWNDQTCTISFNTGAMAHESIDDKFRGYGQPYGENFLPTSDVDGYEVSWYTAKGTKVTKDTIATATQTLYARWTMSVNLNFNGGSGGSATLTATYGSNTLQDVTVPTWGAEGTKAFTGYYTLDVGGPVVIAPPAIGTTVTGFVQGTAVEGYIDSSGNWIKLPTTSEVTLYAQWDDAYTVTFEYHGGSGPITTKAVVKNQQIGAIPTATKTGYTFNGWFTEATGGSIIETTTVISDNIVVHAQWKAAEYTVTLDPADGSVSPNTVTVTYGSNYGNLPTPVRSGYSFSGWYAAATGGSLVTSSTAVSIADNHTLYAHWSSSPSPSPGGGGGGGSNPGSTKYEHIVNPDGSVTDRYTTEIRNTDGSKDTQIVEVTTWTDGSTLKKDSRAYEKTNFDGSSHKEVKETVTATDAEGTVTKTESNSVTDTGSSGASKTTENSRIEKNGHIATRVKVTEITAEGSSIVTDMIDSKVEKYGIITSVSARTDSSGTVANAMTVIQASRTLIDADVAKVAADDLKFAIGLLDVPDVEGQMVIDGGSTRSIRISGEVLTQFADDSGDVTLVFDNGSLTYDQKAIGTLSQYDVLDISFSMDDASTLSDAQKAVIGSASFVSVKAMSGATYIGELNGTVGISFVFGNEQGWNNFSAYCIEDDGKKIGMEWSYDSDSKLAVITSPHLSIFTVLEKTDDPLGGNAMVWICAGIAAVLALVAVAYYIQRAKSC